MATVPQPKSDWTQLADEAGENADLDFTEALPPLPKVVTVNNEDVLQVPMIQPTYALTECQCVPIHVPKIEHSSDTSAPLPTPQQSSRYPTGTRRPPQHLNDYLFATVAEEQSLPTEVVIAQQEALLLTLPYKMSIEWPTFVTTLLYILLIPFTTLTQSNQNQNKNSMA